MIVDGKKIAGEMYARMRKEISSLPPLSIDLFVTGDDLVTNKFIGIKKKIAGELGILVREVAISARTTTEEFGTLIRESAADGVIVQLPLGKHIDTEAVCAAIPSGKDLDVLSPRAQEAFLSGDEKILPPVAGAIAIILDTFRISLAGKKAVVIGSGKLVGAPAAILLENRGADVSVAGRDTADIGALTRDADIIVLGAGEPGLLHPDMVREGAVILDAGTSEAGGKLAGDALPSCAEKASLFTPVPGGVGPLAIAMLFKNLLALKQSS